MSSHTLEGCVGCTGPACSPGKASRGASNSNARGSAASRRARRTYLLKTYRADVDAIELDRHPSPATPDGLTWWRTEPAGQWSPGDFYAAPDGVRVEVLTVTMLCRCYRCGTLLDHESVTVDRIKPGCQGGTYARPNIRPACSPCNSETGGRTRKTST